MSRIPFLTRYTSKKGRSQPATITLLSWINLHVQVRVRGRTCARTAASRSFGVIPYLSWLPRSAIALELRGAGEGEAKRGCPHHRLRGVRAPSAAPHRFDVPIRTHSTACYLDAFGQTT